MNVGKMNWKGYKEDVRIVCETHINRLSEGTVY